MDLQTQTEIEAAAFRALRDHLAKRTDVQNIDMMNLAGFCRNCLSRWYQEAAEKNGISVSKDNAAFGLKANTNLSVYVPVSKDSLALSSNIS